MSRVPALGIASGIHGGKPPFTHNKPMCWIEIFKTGSHVDSNGNQRDWTLGDLQQIAQTYDPAEHEAPLVLGHPEHNSPAYGWVKSLKLQGELLLAELHLVDEQFREWVNQGRFKKRSVSLYPDLSLRHVGFLGGFPPAVKGLRDFAFSTDFFEGNPLEILHNFETKETEMSQETLDEIKQQLAALSEENARLTRELALQKQEKERLQAELNKEKEGQKKAEIEGFIDEKVEEGKVMPAWKEQGLAQFMLGLDQLKTEISFSEGQNKGAGAWFREFLNNLQPNHLFQEYQAPSLAGLSASERLGHEIAAASGATLKKS